MFFFFQNKPGTNKVTQNVELQNVQMQINAMKEEYDYEIKLLKNGKPKSYAFYNATLNANRPYF